MEAQKVEQKDAKKPRECAFINVVDTYVRNNLVSLTSCPEDATNFIFWYVKNDPKKWGLTIKSVPRKEVQKTENFTSQHTWKITWSDYKDKLSVALHCKSLASDVEGENYLKVKDIYDLYKTQPKKN